MKKIKLLLFLLVSLFVTTTVNARIYTDEDIEEASIVIGSHLFTTDSEESTGYNGFLTTKFAMLGASSITGSATTSDMIIYYKWGLGDWEEYITHEFVEFPESVNITHINGVCVDPSCDGTVIEVTLKYNDATPYNNETPSQTTSNMYQSTFAEPVVPTKLGYDFVCWELDGECFDFDTILEENITLEATWSPRTYNVTYHDTVGGTTKTLTCDFASAVPCVYVPYDSDLLFELPAGYTFVGWSIAESGEKVYNNNDIIELYGENTNIDLYSIFSSGTYGVSYNLAGGTFGAAVSPVTEYDPSNLTYNLYTPTRIGYTFKGWTVDTASSTGNAKINTNNTFTITSLGSVTLKATWEANQYNVVYDNNGSLVQLNTKACKYDANCSLDFNKITVPSGKEIKEVSVTVGSNVYVIGSTVKNLTAANEDITAKVTFSDILYNISYDYAGGSGATNTNEMKLGDELTLNVPTRTGYTFNGWTVSRNLTLSGNKITLKVGGDATVTAKWTKNTYNVYYKNGNNDVLLSTTACKYDEFCTLDFSKFKPGKGEELDHVEGSINGVTSTIGDKVFNLIADANGKFYVTPVYSKIPYTVTYNLNGGSIVNPNASVITYGTTLTLLAPSREGYTFDGWEVTSGSATVTNNSVALTAAGDISLRAKWTVKSFTINFDLNGGSRNVLPVTCTYVSCTLPELTPVKTGFEFDGWMYNEAVYDAGDSITLDASGLITFVAKWVNADVYKIKYDLNGGTFNGAPVTTFIVGDSFALTEPSKLGYTFDGWYDSTDRKIENVSGRNADISVKARWTPITYTVYLHKDNTDTNILNEIYCEYGDTCLLGDNADSFENKRLLGWSKSAGGSVFYGDNLELMNLVSEVGDAVHLYPVLEDIEDDFIITYYLDGGSFVDESTVVRSANNGDSISLPEVTNLGYEVDYWITDTGVEVRSDSYTVVSNTVLVPVWKEVTEYTLYLNHGYDDTVEPVSMTCTFGVDCILPTDTFTRYGYDSIGWEITLNGEGGTAYYLEGDALDMSFDVALAQQTFEFDLYVMWEAIPYSIDFITDGHLMPVLTYYIESDIIKVPSSNEQNFVAWSDEEGNVLDVCADDSNYYCYPIPEVLRDLTFTAHYADEVFNVSYNADYEDDRGNIHDNHDTFELTYGDLITGLPSSISFRQGNRNVTVDIVGWTIDGESIDIATYRVTSDVTLKAEFE